MITTQLNYDLFFYSDVVLSKFRQSVMDNPTFMETARGGRYMFLDDFQYLQNRKSTTTTFWRCRNRRTYERSCDLQQKRLNHKQCVCVCVCVCVCRETTFQFRRRNWQSVGLVVPGCTLGDMCVGLVGSRPRGTSVGLVGIGLVGRPRL